MVTEIIQGPVAFEQLAPEWDALVARSMTNTPFQRLAYQRAWWQHLHPEAAQLFTIVMRDEAGQLVAIACFYLCDGLLHFNGCVEETDYLDLIVPEMRAKEAWSAVFQILCGPEFPTWAGLDLCNIPAASPSRRLLQSVSAECGLSWREEVHEVCPIIELPSSFEAYLGQLDKKQRHEVRRKLRRAQAAGVTIHVVGPEDDVEKAVADFLDLLQKSTFEKRDWLNEGRRAIFLDAAQASLADGTLQLMFIEVEGRKGAALFNFDYEGRIWVYNSGFDPTAYGHLSLGVVLTARAIELAIENGRTSFDFLRGDEPYKYRFGAEDTQIFRQIIRR